MHKDYKLRRAEASEIQSRELRQGKRVDPKALEWFREKPYQMRYEEMLRKVGTRYESSD